MASLRIFDFEGVKITGEVVEEGPTKVVLLYPALVSYDRSGPTMRLDRLIFCGETYTLYVAAIRGETRIRDPQILGAYKQYVSLWDEESEVSEGHESDRSPREGPGPVEG